MKRIVNRQILNPTTVTINGTVTDIVDCSAAGGVAVVCKITPTAATGATVQAQWSIDKITWNLIGSPTACTANTTFGYFQDRPAFSYVQLIFAITGGSLAVATTANVNQDT